MATPLIGPPGAAMNVCLFLIARGVVPRPAARAEIAALEAACDGALRALVPLLAAAEVTQQAMLARPSRCRRRSRCRTSTAPTWSPMTGRPRM